MITPLDSTLKDIMYLTWPIIVISVLIISSIRFFDVFKNKKDFSFYKEVMSLTFMIYILCMFQVVTFDELMSYSGNNNFIPFKEIMRHDFGSRLFIKNVIGNMVMFIPFGIYSSYYIKADNKWQSLFLISFASITIECTQLAIGRVFDIDDIILNVFGGIIGYIIYYIIKKIWTSVPNFMKKPIFLNIVTALFLGIFIYYIWMVAK